MTFIRTEHGKSLHQNNLIVHIYIYLQSYASLPQKIVLHIIVVQKKHCLKHTAPHWGSPWEHMKLSFTARVSVCIVYPHLTACWRCSAHGLVIWLDGGCHGTMFQRNLLVDTNGHYQLFTMTPSYYSLSSKHKKNQSAERNLNLEDDTLPFYEFCHSRSDGSIDNKTWAMYHHLQYFFAISLLIALITLHSMQERIFSHTRFLLSPCQCKFHFNSHVNFHA